MNIKEMKEKISQGNMGVVMVGVSGSGKSTLARALCPENGRVISTDEMREMITGDASNQKCSKYAFEIAHTLWEARLRFSQATIFDATSTTPRARRQLTERANEWNTVIAIVLDEEIWTCKVRNASRERQVPEDVIDKQADRLYGNYETLLDNSGFDAVYSYTSETGEFRNIKES